jgi:hypothetical protein
MFASGRDALLSICNTLALGARNYLHIPDYFCAEVVSWCQKEGMPIRRYADSPLSSSPVWETLVVSPGDAVLAVNYFGVRDGEVWRQWKDAHQGIVLIEDHTHDPLSRWASQSCAEYAFASLRKIFPVPDGAMLWSPANQPLTAEPTGSDWTGSALKLAAMVLKKDYLEGTNPGGKGAFREFQGKGEDLLGSQRRQSIAPWSRFLLAAGYPSAWRAQREENVRVLLESIPADHRIRPLFDAWPDGNCPFNAVLFFPSQERRDQCRLRLIAAGVYPAIHWQFHPDAPGDVVELSQRLLTIPADQRYTAADMKSVASILLSEQ